MLTADGQIYQRNLDEPTLFTTNDHSFKQVAVGKDHCAMLTDNGRVMTMGSIDHGKLGHEPQEKVKQSNMAKHERIARDVHSKAKIGFVHGELSEQNVVQVSCGFQHTAALTDKGEIYTWGHGKIGALGHGNLEDKVIPTKVGGLSNIVKIQCGSEYTMALDGNGQLYVWGSNSYGQLGIPGRKTKINTPEKVFLSKANGKVVDFHCGEEHSALLDETGKVHTWGLGIDGQLGHGNKNSCNIPQCISDFQHPAKKVKCGAGHTGIITVEGDLYLMGRGRDGQLGRGEMLESVATERTVPTLVDFFNQHGLQVDDVALGSNHTIAMTSPRSKKK